MLPKKYFIGKIRTYNITFPLYKSNKQTAIAKEQKGRREFAARRTDPVCPAKLTILRQLAKRVRQKK